MLLPSNLTAALTDLPGDRLARRYDLYQSLYGGTMGEIQRLTSPSSAGGVSAIGARVEQIGAALVPVQPEPVSQRQLQLVPIEEPICDDGVCRLSRVLGWQWVEV